MVWVQQLAGLESWSAMTSAPANDLKKSGADKVVRIECFRICRSSDDGSVLFANLRVCAIACPHTQVPLPQPRAIPPAAQRRPAVLAPQRRPLRRPVRPVLPGSGAGRRVRGAVHQLSGWCNYCRMRQMYDVREAQWSGGSEREEMRERLGAGDHGRDMMERVVNTG